MSNILEKLKIEMVKDPVMSGGQIIDNQPTAIKATHFESGIQVIVPGNYSRKNRVKVKTIIKMFEAI